MAVGLVVAYPEVTVEEWGRVLNSLDLNAHPADGCRVHGAGDRGGTVLTFEVWDNRRDFDRFRDERLTWAFRETLRRPLPKAQVTQVDLDRVITR